MRYNFVLQMYTLCCKARLVSRINNVHKVAFIARFVIRSRIKRIWAYNKIIERFRGPKICIMDWGGFFFSIDV